MAALCTCTGIPYSGYRSDATAPTMKRMDTTCIALLINCQSVLSPHLMPGAGHLRPQGRHVRRQSRGRVVGRRHAVRHAHRLLAVPPSGSGAEGQPGRRAALPAVHAHPQRRLRHAGKRTRIAMHRRLLWLAAAHALLRVLLRLWPYGLPAWLCTSWHLLIDDVLL